MLNTRFFLLVCGVTSFASALSCALTAGDWNTIRTAYLERNHYEVIHTDCAALIGRYGNCTQTLGQILATTSLELNCVQHFTSTLYNGPGSDVQALANTLCSAKPFGTVLTSDICNIGSVAGCPSSRDQGKFGAYVSCNGGALLNKTRAEQLEYYASGRDIQCMVREKVCSSFAIMGWDTCPLYISDVMDFIDESKMAFNCTTVFPAAPERCEERVDLSFRRYCPLPTWLEENVILVVIVCLIGIVVIAAAIIVPVWHFRRTRTHHITSHEVLQAAVQNLDTFHKPVNHPELQTVLSQSKFKNVMYDKKTLKWSVIGETRQYDTEQEAAQKAYLNLARLGVGATPTSRAPGNSDISTSSVREFTSMETVSAPKYQQENFVVNAVPLTREQTNALRLQQLIMFYQFWEPEKQDIEGHSRTLLEKHEFSHLVRALKTKFGVCPPLWDTFEDV